MTSYAENTAVIDSGTSYFYLNPTLYYQIVQKYLQGCQNTSQGYFMCNCKSNPMPTLKFMFPGVQVSLPPSTYVTPVSLGYCQVYINTLSTTENTVLLGDTLFFNNIITFDKNAGTVGFCGGEIGPNGQPHPGPSPSPVPIIGRDQGFLISQYIMLSISIIILIYSIVLVCLFNNSLTSELKNPLQENTNIYVKNQTELRNLD